MTSVAHVTVNEDASKFWEALSETARLAIHAAVYTWSAEQMPPGWVLDVGCEYGFGSLLIAETNPSVCVAGVDVDLPALRYSQKTLPDRGMLRRFNADAFRLPVASGSMSGIYLVNLLHLLPDPVGALSEVRRVLAPDGVVVVSVPREPPYGDRPCSDVYIGQLAAHVSAFFAEVACPDEIRGHLPGFPPQSFRLDRPAAPWVALCRQKRPTLETHAA